jgi:Domain of unknown function (DUF1963)
MWRMTLSVLIWLLLCGFGLRGSGVQCRLMTRGPLKRGNPIMMFASEADLATSLRQAGLGMLAADVIATVRPTVLFQRRHGLDKETAIGASKFGGLPDLPRGFHWPVRPPLPGAGKIADGFRRSAGDVRRRWQEYAPEPGDKTARPRFTNDEIAAMETQYERKAEVLFQEFPLAFVAQLDLAALSREAGFEVAFPDTGWLSVFEDVTAGEPTTAPRLFWHDVAATDLIRQHPPRQLIDYSDAISEPPEVPWLERNRSGLLVPHSTLSVPHHWKSAFSRGTKRWDLFWEWFMNAEGMYRPPALAGTLDHRSTYFGDHFAGWPSDIQGHAEDELGGRGAEVKGPGKTIWRHVFSYGGENYADDMLATSVEPTDGNHYILIRDDDLAARRFDRAASTLQFT